MLRPLAFAFYFRENEHPRGLGIMQALLFAFLDHRARFSTKMKIKLVGLAVGLSAIPLGAPLHAYDGPQFVQGLWRFERYLEVSSSNRALPNSKHVRAEPVVTRCVDPTEAMKETFRPVSIGSCSPTAPERSNDTYRFAKRCDYLGPVTTVITIESATAYRETNELIAGPSSKKETVVARRIGDCGSVANLGNAPIQFNRGALSPTQFNRDDPSSYYPPLPR